MIVLHEHSETGCPSARSSGDDLWLSPTELTAATGWELKPEGLCKSDICVPLQSARTAPLQQGSDINVAGLWRHLGRPVVHDDAGDTWVLGAAAADRRAALEEQQAPDFALGDLNGRMHALSHYRGRKVVIATWASW